MSEHDLSVFEGKQPWSERLQKINKMFPSTASLDWYEVFSKDPAVMGRFFSDMVKAEVAPAGRPGKRPSVEPNIAAERYRRYSGDDHTMLPFDQAFKNLKGFESIRVAAERVGLSKSVVHRLLDGSVEPNVDMLEKVAAGYGKHPSYFIEYRVGYVVGMLMNYLEWSPESSVVLYNQLKGRNERAGS